MQMWVSTCQVVQCTHIFLCVRVCVCVGGGGGCQVRACMIRKCYTACEHVSVCVFERERDGNCFHPVNVCVRDRW